MARRLEEVTRGDIDAIRYDDLSFDGSHGHVGVTLFMPSIRQLGIKGEPEIISPYSAGWGEGLGAARASCEGLVRSANVMAATIEYPRKRVAVHEILQFRTEVFGEVIRHIRERTMYDWATLVVAGYSRGTAPARMATVEHADVVDGVVLVAPTWFSQQVKPRDLAARGLHESARGMAQAGWLDRLTLVGASVRLAQEMLAHPFELRNDIAAISQEGAADLQDVLDTGVRVGVVAGRQDELCQVDGIRTVVDRLPEPAAVMYREVDSDHFSYFLSPKPLKVVAEVVTALGDFGDEAEAGDEAQAEGSGA